MTELKLAYLRSQGQTRAHTCHWPGCAEQMPPALWGCATHWRQIPADLQQKLLYKQRMILHHFCRTIFSRNIVLSECISTLG